VDSKYPKGTFTITPIVKAQNGLTPNLARSLNLVVSPMQRKRSTKAQERIFLIGEIALEPCSLSSQSDAKWNCLSAVRWAGVDAGVLLQEAAPVPLPPSETRRGLRGVGIDSFAAACALSPLRVLHPQDPSPLLHAGPKTFLDLSRCGRQALRMIIRAAVPESDPEPGAVVATQSFGAFPRPMRTSSARSPLPSGISEVARTTSAADLRAPDCPDGVVFRSTRRGPPLRRSAALCSPAGQAAVAHAGSTPDPVSCVSSLLICNCADCYPLPVVNRIPVRLFNGSRTLHDPGWTGGDGSARCRGDGQLRCLARHFR